MTINAAGLAGLRDAALAWLADAGAAPGTYCLELADATTGELVDALYVEY